MSKPVGLAPETYNSEQEDEPGQAQTVADEAMHPRRTGGSSGTVKKRRSGSSEQDLVDRMKDMERSGRIDMGAYRGEPSMDDEPDAYGDADDDED